MSIVAHFARLPVHQESGSATGVRHISRSEPTIINEAISVKNTKTTTAGDNCG
jgi:hypothetical protein